MLDRRNFTRLAGIGAGFAASGVAGAVAPVPIGRSSEVKFLREFAEKTHPRGCEAMHSPDWRSRWQLLERNAPAMSDGGYFVATRRALAWFGDGHTTVLPFAFVGGVPEALKRGPFGLNMPIKVRVFDDGAYVTAASQDLSALTGARIERIGLRSAVEVIRAASRDWPGNIAWAHRWSGEPFSSPALLQALGASRDPGAPIELHLAGRG